MLEIVCKIIMGTEPSETAHSRVSHTDSVCSVYQHMMRSSVHAQNSHTYEL